jgi:hypothetical protein
MISIKLDTKTKALLKDLKTADRRWSVGLSRFTAAIAEQVRERVKSAAGQRVDGIDYAKLEIRWLHPEDGYQSYVLVLPDDESVLSGEKLKARAILVLSNGDSERAALLEQFSPWPPDLMPYVPGPSEAQLVSRLASSAELEERATALKEDKDLKKRMQELGLSFPQAPRGALDAPVREDLAWLVLRHEFGLGGLPAAAHWRPSLRHGSNKKMAMELADRFLRFVLRNDRRALREVAHRTGSNAWLPVIVRFQEGLGV